MSRDSLGKFELMVLLGVIRLGDEAYGASISTVIEETLGRDVLLASVHAALERLVRKGMVTSRLGEPTPERGGRAKRYFRVTAKGLREVRDTRQALTQLWNGLPQLKGQLS
jgi:PadR family transcriptional regulator PadR